jgi:hypothetical protein
MEDSHPVAGRILRDHDSTGNGGSCVEVARNLPGAVAVRDSKDPGGPALIFAPAQWHPPNGTRSSTALLLWERVTALGPRGTAP